MSWGIVAGAAIGAVGSAVSSRNNRKAAEEAAEAAEFEPMNVSSPQGQAEYDPNTNSLVIRGSENQGFFGEQFRRIGEEAVGPEGALQGFGSDVAGHVSNPNYFRDLYETQQNAFLNGEVTHSARTNSMRFDELGLQQNQLGSIGMAQALNANGGGARIQDFAFNVGADLLQNQRDYQSFNSLAGERLTALRDAARPSEERAVDSKLNNLFANGRLGSTGGARAMGELALQQEIADQNRVINSQDFANSQQNQQRQFYQQQQQTGMNLFGTALNAANQDASVALSQGQLGANMFGQQGSSMSGSIAASQASRDDVISRAQGRMAGAENLFNFGTGVEQQGIDRALQSLGAIQTTEAASNDLGNISIGAGAAGASAGANAGQLALAGNSSPLGAGLQGIGAFLGSDSGQQFVSNAFGNFSGNNNNAAIGGPGVQNNIIGGIGSAGDQFYRGLTGGGT